MEISSASVMLLVISAIVIILLVAVHVYLLYIHHKYAHLPSPKGAGFYTGHVSTLSAATNEGRYPMDVFYQWADECGPVYVVWMSYKPLVIAAHPDVIKEVCTIRHYKPRINAIHYLWNRQRLIPNSIFTIEHYNDWKDRRRTYDSSFARNFLYSLIPRYNNIVQKYLVDTLKAVADGKTVVDMKKMFARVTLEIISEIAFGTAFMEDAYVQSICGGSDDIMSLTKTMSTGVAMHALNPLLPYIKPFGGYQYTDAAAKVREIGRYCVQKRIKLIENKEECPRDILTQIITLSQNDDIGLGLEDLVDDFITFYLAGHETSSNTLSFTLVELLQSPDLYQRCQAEVDEVLNDSSSTTIDTLEKLELTQAVLEESMRLHPTITETFKITGEEVVTNDYRIPKGTEVWSSSYISHRNPEHFDNPLQFDPSRFEPGQKRPSPYVYFPFGVGHRGCIGRIFAMIELKTVLALLLRNFDLTLYPRDYKLKKEFEFSSKPANVSCIVSIR